MSPEEIRKSSLVGSFVEKSSLRKIIKLLKKDFNVEESKIFIHQLDDNEENYLLTYKISLNYEERKLFRKRVRNTFPLHKKGTSFFTINGLNKLIEKIYKLTSGNINYKSYDIPWKEYENNFIMIKEKDLYIRTINRVFLDT
jgi:hypothetical protein|tara:strand:- start:229 stop:654 length:426 start_codon:yes stop_codon:yes gene_type:complete